ncbi:MAG: SPFH domain-containing protein [Myxococcota bacterium]
MAALLGVPFGILLWFLLRYGVGGFYVVSPNERAVLTTFGRAQRLGQGTTLEDPISASLKPEERERYVYPLVRAIGPGFYWKLPWQSVHKVSVATQTASIAYDPEVAAANHSGQMLEAVTKDQLNIGLTGQLRFTISERNLYAYLFGVRNPIAHVMGYFISVLRDRIANFEAPNARGMAAHAAASQTLGGLGPEASGAMTAAGLGPSAPGAASAAVAMGATAGVGATGAASAASAAGATGAAGNPDLVAAQAISINDLRKHLRDLNERMNVECVSAAARYGIALDAALITGIDSPLEVESALAAINTAYNQVSSEVSLAQAAADQKIVQSRRAVEIETLNAQAEVEPLTALAEQLRALKQAGPGVLSAYIRNAKLVLFKRTKQLVLSREGI